MTGNKKKGTAEVKVSPYTVEEALELLEQSVQLNNLSGFSFGMALSDAVEILEKEKKVMDNMKKPSKEYNDFEKEKIELNKKFSEKDEAGKPKIITERMGDFIRSEFDISEAKKAEWGREFRKLEKKHAATIKEQEEKDEKYQDALKESSTFVPAEIDTKILKKNEVNGGQIRIIRKLFIVK